MPKREALPTGHRLQTEGEMMRHVGFTSEQVGGGGCGGTGRPARPLGLGLPRVLTDGGTHEGGEGGRAHSAGRQAVKTPARCSTLLRIPQILLPKDSRKRFAKNVHCE